MDIFESELLKSFALIGVAHIISRYFWGRLNTGDLFAYRITFWAIVFVGAATLTFWFWGNIRNRRDLNNNNIILIFVVILILESSAGHTSFSD